MDRYRKLTHFPLCRIYASMNKVSIGSDNYLSPDRRQTIIWTKASLLSITLTPYMVLPLFATRFADYAGGIRGSFIQPRLF